jgi:hypothetical protein
MMHAKLSQAMMLVLVGMMLNGWPSRLLHALGDIVDSMTHAQPAQRGMSPDVWLFASSDKPVVSVCAAG